MKILITGINGFLGTHLAYELIKRKHAVVGIGRSPVCDVDGISGYVKGSVLDKKIIKKAFKGINAVVHLAALTAHSDIVKDKYRTLEINFHGTKNILDIFSVTPAAKKFIYSSTIKVYGDIRYLPLDEKHPACPVNILGKSKYLTERLIDFYAAKGKECVILRISNIFGEGQKRNFLIPTILTQLKNTKKIKNTKEITLGDINAKRDYVYIKDVVNAFVLAVEKRVPDSFEVLNVCSGIPRSAKDIVSKIIRMVDYKIKIKVNKNLLRENEMNKEYAEFKKAKNLLGWKPENDLYDWLRKTLKDRSSLRRMQ